MKITRLSGQAFGSLPHLVFHPGALPDVPAVDPMIARLLGEGTAEPAAPLGSDLLAVLTDARPTSERLQRRRDQLLQLLGPILNAVNQFATQAENEWLADVRAEHVAVRKEGEAQQTVCDDLENEFRQVQRDVERLNTIRSTAGLDLAELSERKKHLPRFASNTVIRNLETKITAATEHHKRAVAKHGAALQTSNAMLPKIAAARQRLNDLDERADQLKAVILNQPFAHLGIQVLDPRAWYRREQQQRTRTRPPGNAA